MTDEPTNDRDALNRFWNDLVRGESARSDDVDPALAATIYRLHALRSSPVPIAARSRVRRRVMAGVAPALVQPNGAGPLAPRATRGPIAPPSLTPVAPPRRRFGAPRWLLAQAATAALLLLTLLGALFVATQHPRPGALVATATARGATAVPTWRGNLARTGEMPGPGPTATPTVLWRLPAGSDVAGSPMVADGKVYISLDGRLRALDAATGILRWSASSGLYLTGGPIADSTVFAWDVDDTLHALDAATGAARWHTTIRVPLGSPPVLLSPPAVANGVVYVASGVPSAPAVANGTVYVGGGLRPGAVGVGSGPNMLLYALDANTGRQLWEFDSGDTGGLYALDAATGRERWFAPSGPVDDQAPAVANGVVYIGSGDGALHAVDAATGRERWRLATRGRTNQTAVANGIVYVGSDDDHLYAVDAKTGRERWAFKTDDWVRGAPSVADRVVYVGSDDDTLHAIDAATGRELWHFTGDDPVRDYARSAPAVIGGVVYAGIDRSLYALAAPQPAHARSPVVAQAARANGVVDLARPFIGGIGRGNGTIPDTALAAANLQRALASLALYARPTTCHAPVVLVVGHGTTVADGSRLAGAAIGLLVQGATGLLRDAAYDAAGVADSAPGQVDLYVYLTGDCGPPGSSSATPKPGG